jgi:hypothetical protein
MFAPIGVSQDLDALLKLFLVTAAETFERGRCLRTK